jgi:hypothetical protein
MGEDEDGEDADAGAVVRRLRRAPAVVRALKCLVCDAWLVGYECSIRVPQPRARAMLA